MTIRTKIILAMAIWLFSVPSMGMADPSTQQANRDTVIQFYQKAINEKNFEAAEQFLGGTYIQHNPMAADGKEGLKKFIGYLKANAPQYHSEIKRSFADGDYVILHVHNTPAPGARGKAIVDIFRLQKGKIVEHWDVIQEIPEKAANANGMF